MQSCALYGVGTPYTFEVQESLERLGVEISALVANLPPETLVLNTHSAPQTPVSRLSNYLESEQCQSPGD